MGRPIRGEEVSTLDRDKNIGEETVINNSAVTTYASTYGSPKNVTQLLDIIKDTANHCDGKVTLQNILDVVGQRTFGPILLLAGLVTLTPIIGDIPGVPIIMGTIVFLISVQVLFRKEHFWLPPWLLKRSVKPEKLCKVVGWLEKPAHFIDRFLKPRFMFFSAGPAVHIIAVLCLLVAIVMPVMEMIPFSANGAGAIFTTFGLSLIARDGLLSLIAFSFITVTTALVAYNLL